MRRRRALVLGAGAWAAAWAAGAASGQTAPASLAPCARASVGARLDGATPTARGLAALEAVRQINERLGRAAAGERRPAVKRTAAALLNQSAGWAKEIAENAQRLGAGSGTSLAEIQALGTRASAGLPRLPAERPPTDQELLVATIVSLEQNISVLTEVLPSVCDAGERRLLASALSGLEDDVVATRGRTPHHEHRLASPPPPPEHRELLSH